MSKSYITKGSIPETPMVWLPLALVSPTGPCVVVADGHPFPINSFDSRRIVPADAWFLPVEALEGTWRRPPALPDGEGWVVVGSHPNPNPREIGVCSAAWFRRFPSVQAPWAPLPPWPISAHDRLQAMKAIA